MYLPPPYVPPELGHLKFSEMPEPYKSDIHAWIEHNTRIGERRVRAARNGLIGMLLVAIPLLIAAFYVLTYARR